MKKTLPEKSSATIDPEIARLTKKLIKKHHKALKALAKL